MKKAAAIYFLIVAVPAIGAGLFGEYVAFTFSQQPALDPQDPDYSNPAYLVWEMLFLAILIIGGAAFLPGYWSQIFRPTSDYRLFWLWSAGYNVALLLAFASFIFPMGGPPGVDLSIILFFGLLFGMPSLGLLLSCLCAADKNRI